MKNGMGRGGELMEGTMKDFALRYAKMGFAVLPLKPRSKIPITKNGFKDATTDLQTISSWWDRTPDSNIAIATGSRSGGLVVIDLDRDKEKGIDGYETLRSWQKEYGTFPETWISITGRGGYHLFYKDSVTNKSRIHLYEGIDIRAEDGYVVVPPSIHENGNCYEWEYGPGDKVEIAEVSSTIVNFLMGPAPEEKQAFQIQETIPEVRLINNGANMDLIYYIGPEDNRFTDLNFNGDLLKGIVEYNKPELMIYDPVQAFVPENLRMGDRNAMRKCFSPLIGFGETYKTTSIIIAHANKQSNVWGRKRIADSSDIWDASRSVLMTGIASDNSGIHYLSYEKSNWGKLQDTVLFELNAGVPAFKNYSRKKDREFILEDSHKRNGAPAADEAKEFILEILNDRKQMEVAELDELAGVEGISKNALKDAKAIMRKEGFTHTWSIGNGKSKKFFISLKDSEKTNE